MNRIHILSEEVRNKIAAGEVIEHPASIIRELIDNSIDSNASSISVRLFEDSLDEFSLEIIDNGHGISEEDLSRSFLMHATSKISSFEDIYELETMGFRGEALASIASIAEVHITSSTENTGKGFSISCIGGKTTKTFLTSAPKGTKVVVSKIFFNTPARKKFLSGKVLRKDLFRQEFIRKVLSFEKVGFSLEIISKGELKKKTQIPQRANLLERISILFPNSMEKNLLEVEVVEQHEVGKLFMYGYISDLQVKNRVRKDQYFFVRGRYIQNISLYKSIQSAYMTFLPQKFYPVCFLKIECDPRALDVNVHPTKKDVRFEDTNSIYSFVYQGIKKVLSNHIQVSLNPSEVVDTTVDKNTQKNLFDDESSSLEGGEVKGFPQEKVQLQDNFAVQKPSSFPIAKLGFSNRGQSKIDSVLDREIYGLQKFSLVNDELNFSIRIVGQYKNTYILFEKEENFFMADQHGLHERMLFEEYQRKFSQGIEKQTLLVPFILSFNSFEQESLLKNNEFFEKLGFEIENFGEGLCKIESVPFVFGYVWREDSVKELLELILDNLGQSVEEVTRKISSSLSCWNSIKSGESLPDWKSLELVREFYKGGYVATCPHGRPIIKEWPEMEIKKYFGRDYPS